MQTEDLAIAAAALKTCIELFNHGQWHFVTYIIFLQPNEFCIALDQPLGVRLRDKTPDQSAIQLSICNCRRLSQL